MCVMEFVKHQGITLTLIGRSAIQRVCLFDVCLLVPFHLMTKNLLYLRNSPAEAVTWSSSVVHLKLKRLLKKPTHDDIIGAKKDCIQPSFERYKGN